MKAMIISILLVLSGPVLVPVSARAETKTVQIPVPLQDISLQKESSHSIQRGIEWLKNSQKENGSWQDHPGITALATIAMLWNPETRFNSKDPAIKKGIGYILSCVKSDGSIYKDDSPSYVTSICLMTLVYANKGEYNDVIKNARKFLFKSQNDEEKGVQSDNPFYGGIGYGKDKERPDLSNLQWALEAVKVSESAGENSPEDKKTEKLAWDKALKFLERCQNYKKTNDQSWAGDDGGFVYYPGESKAGYTRSYGSMTYAGLKSFLYAKVDKTDDRVQAAYKWLKQNYSLDENPGLGQQGLYYYFLTMAKALSAYGEDTLVDQKSTSHQWRTDLMQKLVSLQNGDGYWANPVGRWWENMKELSTAYALMTLEIACPNPEK